MKKIAPMAVLLLAGLLAACSSSSSTPTRTVTLTWNQNRESGVNRAGGGYRVSIRGQPVIDVPYVSGSAAPTTTTVQLPLGSYAVTAYAALDAQGGTTGSESAASQSITITVP
jgi:hypothetical protein